MPPKPKRYALQSKLLKVGFVGDYIGESYRVNTGGVLGVETLAHTHAIEQTSSRTGLVNNCHSMRIWMLVFCNLIGFLRF